MFASFQSFCGQHALAIAMIYFSMSVVNGLICTIKFNKIYNLGQELTSNNRKISFVILGSISVVIFTTVSFFFPTFSVIVMIISIPGYIWKTIVFNKLNKAL